MCQVESTKRFQTLQEYVNRISLFSNDLQSNEFRKRKTYFKTRFMRLQYRVYTFVYIPHDILKLSLVRKSIIQSNINLQDFLPIDRNIIEFFCKALFIIYRFLHVCHFKL